MKWEVTIPMWATVIIEADNHAKAYYQASELSLDDFPQDDIYLGKPIRVIEADDD